MRKEQNYPATRSDEIYQLKINKRSFLKFQGPGGL